MPILAGRVRRVLSLCALAACSSGGTPSPVVPTVPAGRNVVILVWDGLRPDAITASDTPNLLRLRDRGTEFTDHHSTYPTFTMMNAASLATGDYPDRTGFYGNVQLDMTAEGKDSAGKPVDFRQPVFTEDYAVLDALRHGRPELLMAPTLFGAAARAGLTTLAVGKTGPAYLQDTARAGAIFDEKMAWPRDLVSELQEANVPLPATTAKAYADGELQLKPDNGSPTDFQPQHKLADGVSSDPTDDSGSPYKRVIDYQVTAYLEHLLPQRHPRLTLVWLRDPDTTEHNYGIGTPNWHDALRGNDALLGKLLGKLESLGYLPTTDVFVVSDHGHSNVSGPQALFPLRAIAAGGKLGEPDPKGHSVSGLVRLADLLRRAGFTAFDGLGCTNSPGATGLRADGSPLYPDQVDRTGELCGKPDQHYQAPAAKVPAQLPPGALIVAVNGGSDYIYVPDHDSTQVAKVVRFLQERAEFGAIFVDTRHGDLPGTLPLTEINAQHAGGNNPDVIVSYDHDADAMVEGMPGTEMAGMLNGGSYRGMHGSFSPRDVHNVLVAAGPDFRPGFHDPLPSGNVDVAPTVAHLLGLHLERAQGRPLYEALVGGPALEAYLVRSEVVQPSAPATGLTVRLPTDPDGKAIAPLHAYSFELHEKRVRYADQVYEYYDFAKATRK